MKPSLLVETAHKALQAPDRQAVDKLLAAVNLSLLEREIIARSEIDNSSLESICNSLKHWDKKQFAVTLIALR